MKLLSGPRAPDGGAPALSPFGAAEVRRDDALQLEVERLGAALQEAPAQRAAAEGRCDLLERQLDAVGRATAVVLPTGPQGMHKILIVDDQPDSLLAMTAVLATLGQELVRLSSGREALKALLDHDDFAVIIMDAQMPETDRHETCAHVKRLPRTRDVPIIFLTAMGTGSEHSARGYAAGAVDYISKPFDPWALRAKRRPGAAPATSCAGRAPTVRAGIGLSPYQPRSDLTCRGRRRRGDGHRTRARSRVWRRARPLRRSSGRRSPKRAVADSAAVDAPWERQRTARPHRPVRAP